MRKHYEIDFVCNQNNSRYYVQVVLNLETREKTLQETRPLLKIDDFFKRVIIVKDDALPWVTEEGVLIVGIMDFY